ncbi:MAG: ATP-dependent sacrificial sulfur transferase LarE [Verrucomicrobia bacterium]|nr:ATP-dependent sacrificial sulfur transferase LarE [Verrucomicrobiota bacterium]
MADPVAHPGTLPAKEAVLREALRPRLAHGLIVAYSGGVDSSFLLWVAEQERRRHGGRLLAVTAVSASLAQMERQDAARFVAELGVEHRWENSRELSNPDYTRNDLTRCYHCKTELFRLSHALAASLGYSFIAYGYNASDRGDFRPGQTAAAEQGILAPLDDADLAKEEIRSLMRAYDIPFAEKAASPCLSSRLMTGVAVTPQRLRDVEELEAILHRAGLGVFRVRLHEYPGGQWLRLEVMPAEMTKALSVRDELQRAARQRGYAWVTLDLAGYRMGGGNRRPG